MAWKGGFDGRGYTLAEIEAWLRTQPKPSWAKGITQHNTGVPGITRARQIGYPSYVRNAGGFYRASPPRGRGWSGGPHFFVTEEEKVYFGTPFTVQGVHDPCHNGDHWGIEMIANFDGKEDDDDAGAGLKVKNTAAALCALLLTHQSLPLNAQTLTLHKDCKKTTHDCPGKDVERGDFMDRVASLMGAKAALVAMPAPQPALPAQPGREHDPKIVPEIGHPSTFDVKEGADHKFAPPTPEEIADRPRWAVRLLRDLHWPKEAAVALIGGFQEEAYKDLRTGAVGDKHIPGGSVGLGQWNGPRKDAFVKLAAARGTSIADFETNILFANWELEHGEIGAGQKLAAAKTVWSAAIAAIGYERPAGWSVLTPTRPPSWRRRLDNAIALYNRLPK